MKTRQLGDITIDRILELEAPLAQPLEFFDEALPEAVEYAACEAGGTAVCHENVRPIMEAGQAVLVDTD